MTLRRIAILVLGLVSFTGAGCTDPRSPVDDHQPGWGVVRAKQANSYGNNGEIVFFYLRIATRYGTFWVEEDFQDWSGCQRGETWARALGCL